MSLPPAPGSPTSSPPRSYRWSSHTCETQQCRKRDNPSPWPTIGVHCQGSSPRTRTPFSARFAAVAGGRRLLGLARVDAGRGRATDPADRPRRVRACVPGDARRRLHRRRRVPLPRARRGSAAVEAAEPPESRSCCCLPHTSAAGSSGSAKARWPSTSTRSSASVRAARTSASHPTPSEPARQPGWPRSAAMPSERASCSTCTPTSSRARSRSASRSTACGRSSSSPARGCLTSATTVIHATHAVPAELDLIADAGAAVCLCPTTEANLGDGFPPLEGLLERGIRLAIGSDANVRLDPLEELRELEGTARRLTGRREVIPVPDLLAIGSIDRRRRARPRRLAGRRGRPRSPCPPRSRPRGRAGRARLLVRRRRAPRLKPNGTKREAAGRPAASRVASRETTWG